MAISMDQLKRLLDNEGLRYFLDPRRDAVMLSGGGMFGVYQCVILLEMNGTFLQFRSLAYAHCTQQHPQLAAVLRLLAEVNYLKRMFKIGWDADDGEITAYLDVWIEDNTLTQAQFGQVLRLYFSVLDSTNRRLRQVLETGKDPGELGAEDIVRILREQGIPAPPGGGGGAGPRRPSGDDLSRI